MLDYDHINSGNNFRKEEYFKSLRRKMVDTQILQRGISDPSIISSMLNVPRHLFVHEVNEGKAYSDRPLPLNLKQTISQPYIIALMMELAKLDRDAKVLEIGTGSGYQTALLANIVNQVFSVEFLEPLFDAAKSLLSRMKYNNIRLKLGDGKLGWNENAPFDVIIVSAAPRTIPEELENQIVNGGRIIIPIGSSKQILLRITKDANGFQTEKCASVSFVPLV